MSTPGPPPPPPDGSAASPAPVPPPPPPVSSAPPPPPGALPPTSFAPGAAAAVGGPISGAISGAKPPRPSVRVGSVLMVVGSLVAAAGTFLAWVTDTDNGSGNGYDRYLIRDGFTTTELDNPGAAVMFFALVTLGLGIALFFAGRVLACAIIGIVAAAIAVLVGLVMIGLMAALTDDIGGSVGLGVALTLLGPLVTLAGAIAATSKRRRWPRAT